MLAMSLRPTYFDLATPLFLNHALEPVKSSVVGSEGERRVAMRPGVVPLAVGGGVDGRRGVAVERAGRADHGGGCGGGCARRGGRHGAGGGRAGGRRQGQLVVTSRHAVEHLGQVGRALQDRLLRTRYDTRCYFNVRSKADTSQLNLPHGNNN